MLLKSLSSLHSVAIYPYRGAYLKMAFVLSSLFVRLNIKFFHELITKVMAFKLHFTLHFYVAYFVYISKILLNMYNWMQLSHTMVFSASSFVAITHWLFLNSQCVSLQQQLVKYKCWSLWKTNDISCILNIPSIQYKVPEHLPPVYAV